MVENDVSGCVAVNGVRCVMLFFRACDVVDTPEGYACLAHFGDNSAELTNGPYEHGVIRNDCNKVADAELPVYAEYCSEYEDYHYLNSGENVAH